MTAVVPATGLHEERASVSASGSGATCPLPLGRAARRRKEEDPQAETALRVYRPHPPLRRGHVGEGVGTWRGRTVHAPTPWCRGWTRSPPSRPLPLPGSATVTSAAAPS